MSRYFLVAALVVGFSVPAMAAKGRGAHDQCKIVNIAPYYTQTRIRKGKRVFITREVAPRDMAIICND
jgi:hypothetical protein